MLSCCWHGTNCDRKPQKSCQPTPVYQNAVSMLQCHYNRCTVIHSIMALICPRIGINSPRDGTVNGQNGWKHSRGMWLCWCISWLRLLHAKDCVSVLMLITSRFSGAFATKSCKSLVASQCLVCPYATTYFILESFMKYFSAYSKCV